MASQAAHFLIQADLLPELISPAWDTSALLPDDTLTGKLLHGLIGYDSRPDGMQLVFYCITLALIFTGMKWTAHARRPASGKT
jgi:high-affinity iron transporter